MPSTRSRKNSQGSARESLRTVILDAMRDLLLQRDWSKITLTEVATGAGVSRQTVYNEFGSRSGLAESYAFRLADQLVDHVEDALAANVGDVTAMLRDALTSYFVGISQDPLVQSLLLGEVKLDLLRIVTLDGGPLLDRATGRLSEVLQQSWGKPDVDAADAGARAIVRLVISHIQIPPTAGEDPIAILGTVLGPYISLIFREPELR